LTEIQIVSISNNYTADRNGKYTENTILQLGDEVKVDLTLENADTCHLNVTMFLCTDGEKSLAEPSSLFSDCEHQFPMSYTQNAATGTLIIPSTSETECYQASTSSAPVELDRYIRIRGQNDQCVRDGNPVRQLAEKVTIQRNRAPVVQRPVLHPKLLYQTTFSFTCTIVDGITDEDGISSANHKLSIFRIEHGTKGVTDAFAAQSGGNDIVGVAQSGFGLTFASDKVVCKAQPTDGCDDGIPMTSEPVTVQQYLGISPSEISVAGSVPFTIFGDSFIPNYSYTIQLSSGTNINSNITASRRTMNATFPRYSENTVDVELKGKFWQPHGCGITETASTASHTISGKYGIYSCYAACGSSPTIVGIGLQGSSCKCFNATPQLPSASPDRCTTLCMEDNGDHDACGGTGTYYSYYAFSAERTVNVKNPKLQPSPPDPATNLVQTSTTSKSITVSWAAPSFTGAATIDYTLFLDGNEHQSPQYDTEYKFEGLDGGTEYSIGVVAKNSAGSAQMVNVTASTSEPVAPGRITFKPDQTAFEHTQENAAPKVRVELSWDSPDDDGGSPVNLYQYKAIVGQADECNRDLNASKWKTFISNVTRSGGFTQQLAEYFDPETQLTVQLRALNQYHGESVPGLEETIVVAIPGQTNEILVNQINGTDANCAPCDENGACPLPCKSIGGALKITSVIGQIIRVLPGNYKEHGLKVNVSGVKMLGEGEGVTLDCMSRVCILSHQKQSNSGSIWYFPAEINGLDMKNGRSEQDGGCVQINSAPSGIALKNIKFTNCTAGRLGGAVSISASSYLLVENVSFVSNRASLSGGGMSSLATASIHIKASLFEHNAAQNGGGLALLTESYVAGDGEGAAGESTKTACSMENSHFIANKAVFEYTGVPKPASQIDGGGGGVFVFSNKLSSTKCSYIGNQAIQYGAGIFAEKGELIDDSSSYENNKIVRRGGGGGGIACLSSTMLLSGITVKNNSAGGSGNGGGGWFTFCSPSIKASSWTHNVASSKGGAVYFGIMSFPKFKTPTNIFLHNEAGEAGGALGCFQCAGMDLANVRLELNVATDGVGGCIAIEDTKYSSITNSEFKNCSALNGGGAIYMFNSAKLNIASDVFSGNKASASGGGAILWGFSKGEMVEFSKGAKDVPVTYWGNTFKQNVAAYGPDIASISYSLYMIDGPSKETVLNIEQDDRRISQGTEARNWEVVTGGKGETFSLPADRSFDGKEHYVKVAMLDWYNHIVRSSNSLVRLQAANNGIGISGTTETTCVDGVATFDDFSVEGVPGSPFHLKFASADAAIIQEGSEATVDIRNCTAGEFYETNGNQNKCTPCQTGKYGDDRGKHTSCKACTSGKHQDETGKTSCKSCSAGQYQDASNAEQCKDCDAGQSQSMVGKEQCNECTAGAYADEAKAESCKSCERGKFRSEIDDARSCNDCPAGKYSPNDRSTSCKICEGGKTTGPNNDKTGETECTGECSEGTAKNYTSLMCTKCKPGLFSNRGASKCEKCAVGTYSNSGEGQCSNCRIGQYASKEGAPGCSGCTFGKYAPVEGMKECDLCPESKFRKENGTDHKDCIECPKGTWTLGSKGATVCHPCTKGEEYSLEQRKCLQCPGQQSNGIGSSIGKYSLLDSGNAICIECPVGAHCLGGASLVIKAGHWVSGGPNTAGCSEGAKLQSCTQTIGENKTAIDKAANDCQEGEFYDECGVKRKITACGNEDAEALDCETNSDRSACKACLGTSRPAINASMAAADWNSCNAEDGYYGRLCQSCLPGYARESTNPLECAKCTSDGVNYILIVAGIFLATCALGFFVKISMADAGSTHVSGAVQKILLNYLQTVSVAAGFPLKWPSSLAVMFAVQSGLSTFSDHITNFDCQMVKQEKHARIFWQKQIFFASLPAFILIFNAFFWYINSFFRRSKPPTASKDGVMQKHRRESFQLMAKSALHHSRTLNKQGSLLDHIRAEHSKKKRQDNKDAINSYQRALDSRGDGTAVKLTRDFLTYIHTHEKTKSQDLIKNNASFTEEGGRKRNFLTRKQLVDFSKKHKCPFNDDELARICDLLDPKFTDKITVGKLISFYRTVLDKIILSSTIIMFVLYPTICSQIFKLLACRPNLEPSGHDGQLSSVAYLLHDVQIQCGSGVHLVFLSCVGIPSIILWILGFPLMSIFVLRSKKGTWDDRSFYRYSMFLNGYKADKYYWECIIAIRKASLTFVSVYFAHMGVAAQAYAGIFVLFVFLSSHVALQPFANKFLNQLETSALTISFCTMYLGLLFYMSWIRKLPAFETALTILIILGNIGFMFWALKLIVGKMFYQCLWICCGRKCARKAAPTTTNNTKVSPFASEEREEMGVVAAGNN
jgi:hypothetical protein